MPNTLYWVDLETTGLDCQSDDLLEIAIGVSEFNDPFNVKIIYEQRFHTSKTDENIPARVLEMHSKSGLWQERKTNPALPHAYEDGDEIQERLIQLVPFYPDAKYDDSPVLAGSAVHFDRAFLREFFPKFEKLFHHRHYDVSAVKLFCESLGMPKLPKGEAHLASLDIQESASHAKACAEWLVNIGDQWF